MYLASQIINLVGMGFGITAFQCKKHSQIMFFKIVHEFLAAAHYILLGAYTGAAMNLISCFRNGLFSAYVTKGKKTTVLIVIFSVIFVILGAMVWEGPKSIFVIGAKVLTCIAYGCKDTAMVRKLSLVSNTGWLIYNLIVFSVTGFVCDSLLLTSVITGMIRHDLPEFRKKRQMQKEAVSQTASLQEHEA